MTEAPSRRAQPAVAAAAALTLVAFAALAGFMLRPALLDHREPTSHVPGLNPIEVGFLQDMTAHHQQAVEMGRMIDRPGVDERIRTLGRQIVQNQQYEIGTMIGWLQLTGHSLTADRPMGWMTRYAGTGRTGHHDDGEHPMPGMSTADEVAALGSLPPAEAEDRFLIQMQRHHYGGIAMTQDLVAQVPHGTVNRLATTMMSSQTKETGLMGAMITERGLGT